MTHRDGFSPRTRYEPSFLRTTSKPGSLNAFGRMMTRSGTGSARAAWAATTISAIAYRNSRSPSVVAAETS